mgnify:CR=1 FL=1
MNLNYQAMACPSCGFTREGLVNDSASTAGLVQVDDTYYGLLFNRNRCSDVLLKIHYCPKCGHCLDGQKMRGCSFCEGESVKGEDSWGSRGKKSSLSVGTSITALRRYEPTLMVENILDDYDYGSHADITFCPFCGKKLKKEIPIVNNGENTVQTGKKRKRFDILFFMKKKGGTE